MPRPLRRWLSRIAYYSARRERTVWTRCTDTAIIVAPLLALLATATTHLHSPRPARVVTLSGVFVPRGGDSLDALLDERASQASAIVGDFSVQAIARTRGWPFPSGESFADVALTKRFVRFQPTPDLEREAREAVERTLRAEAGSPLAEALVRGAGQRNWSPWGAAANFALWWIGLTLLLPLAIQVLRLASWAVSEPQRLRRRRRVRRGRCPSCDFDLRASVWSSHCPECGELLE